MEAEGHASAIRAQGEAEAEIIFKKGEAEAKAMNVKAEAYQEFNQAAIVDKLITGLPEMVRALAAPLANVDKITIVSTGNGDSAGMNKITGDITKMAAQIPALFETLSGMPLRDLFAKVRLIGDKSPKPGDKAKARRSSQGSRGSSGSPARRSAPRPMQRRRVSIMALLERVSTLIRANLNDLVDKAEDPGKDDQAGHPGHAEPVAPGEDAGGDFDRRPARAGDASCTENEESEKQWVQPRRAGGG